MALTVLRTWADFRNVGFRLSCRGTNTDYMVDLFLTHTPMKPSMNDFCNHYTKLVLKCYFFVFLYRINTEARRLAS